MKWKNGMCEKFFLKMSRTLVSEQNWLVREQNGGTL